MSESREFYSYFGHIFEKLKLVFETIPFNSRTISAARNIALKFLSLDSESMHQSDFMEILRLEF